VNLTAAHAESWFEHTRGELVEVVETAADRRASVRHSTPECRRVAPAEEVSGT
jgi:hypothetical protein